MFVIVTYDIGVKRVAKVMKICRKYLTHVQKSVFEGIITEAKLGKLKKELLDKIEYDEDQICIYEFDSLRYSRKEVIGAYSEQDNIL